MKLKCVMFFLVATIVPSSCVSKLVIIPQASVLNQRLNDLGLQHFAKRTGIVEKFAGGVHKVCDVRDAVNGALDDYGKRDMPAFAWLVGERRSDVIKAFLRQ